MDWDWEARPTYESDRIRIDGRLSPVVFYDMKKPRLVEDHEIGLMLSAADFHLERGLPFSGLVRHQRGTGVIGASQRKALTDWLEVRRDNLQRDDVGVVVVVPEAIVRAVLRVVYRFRTPPVRTITAPDLLGATDALRAELSRIGCPITPRIDAFLSGLSDPVGSASA